MLFFIPVVLLAYPLDIYLSSQLRKSQACYGEYEVWNDIYSGNINADILIYGSSRAWVNINPKILNDSLNVSVYNLGLDGHNFWLQYLRHLEYLKNNLTPKHIILAVDFNTLHKRSNLYLYEQFLPYMIWNKNIREYTISYNGFNYLDYKIPLLRYFGEKFVLKEAFKMIFSKPYLITYRKNGYRGVHKSWRDDLKKAKLLMDKYEISLDDNSIQLFEKFLLECKMKQINITMVYTPEHIEGQGFIKNRRTVINLYRKFALKHNLQFLDYSNDSICYNKEYFYNSTHLNKTGSELFSKKLLKDLKFNYK